MDKIGVRIKCSGGTLMGAEITDLATGFPLTGVTHVWIDMPIDAPCLATITVLAEVEVEIDGEIVRNRLLPDGSWTISPPEPAKPT